MFLLILVMILTLVISGKKRYNYTRIGYFENLLVAAQLHSALWHTVHCVSLHCGIQCTVQRCTVHCGLLDTLNAASRRIARSKEFCLSLMMERRLDATENHIRSGWVKFLDLARGH